MPSQSKEDSMKLTKSPARKSIHRGPAPKARQEPKAGTKRKVAKRLPADTPASGLQKNSKLASVIAMLRHPKGASIDDLCKATGWQAHSVRGAMSGAIKKKLGLAVSSGKVNGVRTYRIRK
jgi:hypothetical protein